MSFQDTRERIFVNGQIYSRPRFGGRVHGPDTRQFTPDPNPYDVEPEPRGYGQGSVDVPDLRDLLFRPTDTFDIRKPVYRPEDKVEVQPLELAKSYTTVDPSELPEAVEFRRKTEDFFQEMNPNPSIDPSKLDLREYRRPGPYVPGEDLDRDRFIRSDRSPIASNPETGKRDFLYQYLEQNKEVMGPKNQMFGRYANPDDGTLNNDEMAQLDPTGELLLRSLRKGEIGPLTDPNIQKAIRDLERQKYNRGRASSMDGALMAADPVDKAAYGPQMTRSQFSDYNELRSPGYKDRRDALRMRLIDAGILRGV